MVLKLKIYKNPQWNFQLKIMQESTENNFSDSLLPRNWNLQYGCIYSYLDSAVTDPKTSVIFLTTQVVALLHILNVGEKIMLFNTNYLLLNRKCQPKMPLPVKWQFFHLCKIEIIMLTTIWGALV